MAMRYPDRVDKLVTHGPNYTVDGLAADHLAWFKSLTVEDMVPMFEEQYSRTAPDPDHLPVILARFQELLLREPAYTVENLGQIQAPTLVLDGDLDDWIVREHLETLAASIPNGQLVFLPELTHFAPYEDPAAWTEAVLAFLHEPPAETTQMAPRLEPMDCMYPVLAEANAECGYLVVSEERSNPDSPTIRVPVIKFLAASENPAPDPVIVIPGGPGSSGPFYAWLISAMPAGEMMRADRDVYVLETRGAMYSQPAFYCPETQADVGELVTMTMAEEQAWTSDAYRACHDRLVAEGVNLSSYGFLEIAGDVADLRTALGVDEVNVYGVSYGTTPAMLLMRERPEGVRSVILDSIIPPDVTYLESVLGNLTASLERIFTVCAADPVCNAAYPDLKSVFTDLLAELREEPVDVSLTDEAGEEHTVTVDDLKFVHFAYDSIFIGDGFTTLPASIYAASEGDLRGPAEGWLGYVGGQHGEVGPEVGSWARGMTYAAMCLQDGSTTDLATATAVYDAVDTLPSVHDWGVTHMLGEWLAPCEYWAVTPPDPNISVEPVESDLPTLMLGGLFDPEAPPAISLAAAERLPNSFFYQLPAGHGLLFVDCAVDLMAQFLADPTQEPDASCIDAMPMNWVLPE
jgi:pimeloyl-ACP methyl ester carboxylesterase